MEKDSTALPKNKLTHKIESGKDKRRYQIINEIGRGASSHIYKAYDQKLNRTVALKVLSDQLLTNEEALKIFLHEARSAAKLDHSNIVTIYDVGTEEGKQYISMRYIEGKDLRKILEEKAPLPLDEALRITCKICDALGYAHQRGIIHRDIKPSNILIDKKGEVMITDFGIAKVKDATLLPMPGMPIGTPKYISPEQAKGDSDIDERSDIYSLGIVLYEMVTGKVPFEAEDPLGLLYKHINETPKPPTQYKKDLPQGLENIILKILEKEKDKRYQKTGDLSWDLVQYSEELLKERKKKPLERKRNRWLKIGIPLTIILVLALVFGKNLLRPKILEVNWRYQTEGVITSSPTISDGLVYIGSNDGYLYAFKEGDGTITWKKKLGSWIFSSPTVQDKKIYLGSGDGCLYALEEATGLFKWRRQLGGYIRSSPAVAERIVYIGCDDHYLYAFSQNKGRIRWRFTTQDVVRSTPVISQKTVYFGSGDGHLYAIEALEGSLKWRYKTGKGYQAESWICSSPIVSEGVVYFGAGDSYFYALHADTGLLKWRYRTGGHIVSSPKVDSELVYIGSNDGYLYAFGKETGSLKWKYRTRDYINSSPEIVQGNIYFGSGDGFFYVLRASNGKILAKYQTSDSIDSSPKVSKEMVYIGSGDGYLYAFKRIGQE